MTLVRGRAFVVEDSRQRVMTMPLPEFRDLDARIDDPLNVILQRAINRDLTQRYQTADELLGDLEHYIYDQGYGPTNETLGRYIRELFGQSVPPSAVDDKGRTQILEHTSRLFAKT